MGARGAQGVRHDARRKDFHGTAGIFRWRTRHGRRVRRHYVWRFGASGRRRSGRHDQESDRHLRRARQGDRPHLAFGSAHRSDGRVRCPESDAAGLRYAPAHGGAAHRLIRRSGRDQARRRGTADLYRLDVRRKPRASRRGAPGVRRLAHQLQDAGRRQAARECGERAF